MHFQQFFGAPDDLINMNRHNNISWINSFNVSLSVGFMNFKLKVFKLDATDYHLAKTYRFAVVDHNRSKSYPANFVCMLPAKVDRGNGKITNVFETLFGDKSVDFAVGLLNEALKSESDIEVKAEIERRLKLLDTKQIGLVECRECKETFRPQRIRKYNQYLCRKCYRKRFGYKQ